MKIKAFMITMMFAVLSFITGVVFAANGDLIVNGNLGVGTSTPAAKAEVNGNLKVDGTITSSGAIVSGNATIMGAATVSGDAAISGTTTVNGNLGVGTTSPTQKLDVNGYVKASSGVCIGDNCTTTLQVSAGLYGFCADHCSDETCTRYSCDGTAYSPAFCNSSTFRYGKCACPSGYTIIQISFSSNGQFGYACYKN